MKLSFLKSVCISAMAITLVACGSNTAETTVETPDAVTEGWFSSCSMLASRI